MDGLPVANAADAVRVVHAVGAARSAESHQLRARARKTGKQVRNDFFAVQNYVLDAQTTDASEPSANTGLPPERRQSQTRPLH